jgi:predicted DNA-binding WGR domain protein
MIQELIYQDEKSNKFWRIETDGASFTVTFGKIGTSGQTQAKVPKINLLPPTGGLGANKLNFNSFTYKVQTRKCKIIHLSI